MFSAGAGVFFAGAGAGAGGEKPGVCTALPYFKEIYGMSKPLSSIHGGRNYAGCIKNVPNTKSLLN